MCGTMLYKQLLVAPEALEGMGMAQRAQSLPSKCLAAQDLLPSRSMVANLFAVAINSAGRALTAERKPVSTLPAPRGRGAPKGEA